MSLDATLHVCGACGHVQALLEKAEACVSCGARTWSPAQGESRQKALMPKPGVL